MSALVSRDIDQYSNAIIQYQDEDAASLLFAASGRDTKLSMPTAKKRGQKRGPQLTPPGSQAGAATDVAWRPSSVRERGVREESVDQVWPLLLAVGTRLVLTNLKILGRFVNRRFAEYTRTTSHRNTGGQNG